METRLETVQGQPSWRLKNRDVTLWVTRRAGMLAPALFRLADGRTVQPFAIAPWAEEKLPRGTPRLLQVLRGDFLGAPFGGNGTRWCGEQHPPHGETANADWTLAGAGRADDAVTLDLRLTAKIRPGLVDKRVMLRAGHSAIYCENTLSGFSGSMPIGTHPCLHVRGGARVSVGGWNQGQVFPGKFEDPKCGGYSSLHPGARFKSLAAVPQLDGGTADLTRFPAREGFEDLVMLLGRPGRTLGWSAVTFPQERWVFLQLKNPEVLRHTVLWHSHGGRHYAPWNGRHRNVLGLEETTSYFHLGQAESARANSLNREGWPTAVKLSPKRSLRIAHIFAVAAIPRGFDIVEDVVAVPGGVRVTAQSGRTIQLPLDPTFLRAT